jgi:hypothetical protein
MSARIVTILDNEKDAPVEAALRDDLTADELFKAEKEWRPARLELLQRCKENGLAESEWPQHWKWDWEAKAEYLSMLACSAFGIFLEGKWQGLMLTTTAGHQARLEPDQGKDLVYCEFLESAPWNLQKLLGRVGDKARFRGIGPRLLEAAICLSLNEGFHGRLGLLSLPQSEGFYRGCGMTDLGPSPRLNYFEMTRTQATSFLKGGSA